MSFIVGSFLFFKEATTLLVLFYL